MPTLRQLASSVVLTAFATPTTATCARCADARVAAAWWPGYLAGRKLVSLPDGRVMDLYCDGGGTLTVMLDYGLGDAAWTWRMVQGAIAGRTRVCVYDRAGYGRSSPGPMPRDTAARVDDLHALTRAAGLPPPYILVGHSLASFDVRLFAFRYPAEMAGMVLVDPSADWQDRRMDAVFPGYAARVRQSWAWFKECEAPERSLEVVRACELRVPPDAPAGTAALISQAREPAAFSAISAEFAAFEERDSKETTSLRRPLGSLPLVVLTAAENDDPTMNAAQNQALQALWTEMHRDMAKLSDVGEARIVPRSGHAIQIDRPQAVIDAVVEVMDRARGRPHAR